MKFYVPFEAAAHGSFEREEAARDCKHSLEYRPTSSELYRFSLLSLPQGFRALGVAG